MLTGWLTKQIPDRLLSGSTVLLILVMSSFLALYGHSLYLQMLWEHTSASRQYFQMALENNASYEYFVQRMSRVEVFSVRDRGKTPLTMSITHFLYHQAPESFSDWPTVSPAKLLIGSKVPDLGKDTVSQLQRFAVLEKAYWGDNSPTVRSIFLESSGNMALVIPGSVPMVPLKGRSISSVLKGWLAPIQERYARDQAQGLNNELIWAGPYRDELTGLWVMSCFSPVRVVDGRPEAFVVTTMTDRQLLADFRVQAPHVDETRRRVAVFSGNGGLIYRGDALAGVDLAGMAERVRQQTTGHGDMALAYWFDHGNLLIAGGGTGDSGRAVYIYPLLDALADYRWQVLTVLALYLSGVLGVLLGTRQFRQRVLQPMRQNVQRVADSELFNRTVLQTAPVGLRVVRMSDGEIQAENKLAEQVLPHQTQYQGRSWADSLQLQPDGAAVRLELQVLSDDDKVHDVLVVGQHTRYQGDDVLLCAISDVSDERETRRVLQQARELSDRANAAKSQFLAIMSHEIRTPLFGALGTLEMLSMTNLSDSQRQQLNTVQASSKSLLQIINDLLDYSKVEAGQMDIESQPFDLIELTEGAVRAQSSIAMREGLDLICQAQPDLPQVAGDPIRVRQVLDNLLGNALKFTKEGKVSARVWSEPFPGAEGKVNILLEVADTGIGISPDAQIRLFEPFVQAESSIARYYGGTGLGLSICRQLVGLMGGEIRLDSIPGEGSRFTVLLPLELSQAVNLAYEPVEPALPPVAVLANDDGCRQFLLHLIQIQGGQAIICPGDAPAPGMVLLIATTVPPILPSGYIGTVILKADGPMEAKRRGDSYIVSTYHQHGILRALCAAGGVSSHSTSAPPLSAQALPKLGLQVLVVDDHPYNRSLIQQQLEQLGCKVQLASDGEEGLSLFRQGYFDTVLTDIHMPGMSGYEFSQLLRAEGYQEPIIGLTASIASGEVERCLAAGMNRYLSKPVFLTTLADCLCEVLPERIAGLALQPAVPDAADTTVTAGISESMRTLLTHTLHEDLDKLWAAIDKGDLHKLIYHAHRMRGAVSQGGTDDIGEVAELCRELEFGAEESLKMARFLVDDLRLYLDAYLDPDMS